MADLLTLDDLRLLIVEQGDDPLEVLTEETTSGHDPEACCVFRQAPEGRVVMMRERGETLFHETYEDDPTAVRAPSERFKPLLRRPAPTPEQLAWSREVQDVGEGA